MARKEKNSEQIELLRTFEFSKPKIFSAIHKISDRLESAGYEITSASYDKITDSIRVLSRTKESAILQIRYPDDLAKMNSRSRPDCFLTIRGSQGLVEELHLHFVKYVAETREIKSILPSQRTGYVAGEGARV